MGNVGDAVVAGSIRGTLPAMLIWKAELCDAKR